MSIGLNRQYPSNLHLPYPLSRHFDRAPSPTPSQASSIYSQGTSIDSLGDMPAIDKVRPIYDSSSAPLEDRMKGDWAGTTRTDGPQNRSVQTSPLDHRIEDTVNEEKGSSSSGSSKGKEVEQVRRFPEEEDEEILKESNSRFVLFPIKFREVS